MSLSKKHFVAMASILRGAAVDASASDDTIHGAECIRRRVALELADYCALQAPAFDRSRFLDAAGIPLSVRGDK